MKLHALERSTRVVIASGIVAMPPVARTAVSGRQRWMKAGQLATDSSASVHEAIVEAARSKETEVVSRVVERTEDVGKSTSKCGGLAQVWGWYRG